jgi:hypothetical protein
MCTKIIDFSFISQKQKAARKIPNYFVLIENNKFQDLDRLKQHPKHESFFHLRSLCNELNMETDEHDSI